MASTIPVTSFFALLLTLLIIYLALQVVRARRRFKIGYGADNNETLCKAIGAHANAVENIPIALLLMLMLELNKLNSIVLIALASAFFIARVFQAFGLSSSVGVSFGRTYGTMFSWLIMIAMAALNVVIVFT